MTETGGNPEGTKLRHSCILVLSSASSEGISNHTSSSNDCDPR